MNYRITLAEESSQSKCEKQYGWREAFTSFKQPSSKECQSLPANIAKHSPPTLPLFKNKAGEKK